MDLSKAVKILFNIFMFNLLYQMQVIIIIIINLKQGLEQDE
jgi:hypothetical protein